MPFNGSGTYSPPSPPTFPAVAGTKIRASYFNSVINDLATALSNCVARDGQSTITNAMTFLGIDAQDVTATSFSVDSFFTSLLVGGNPVQKFDDKDYLSYDRTNNLLKIHINAVEEFAVSTADGPYRTDDAATPNGLVRKLQMDTAITAATTAMASTAETLTGTSTTKAVTPAGLRATMLGTSAQTWQDKTSTRATGTTYFNSTNAPIMVFVESASGSTGVLTVGGLAMEFVQGAGSPRASICVTVPPGVGYSVTNSFANWYELR